MNTNEINSKYTITESIDNRLKQIEDLYDTINNNISNQERIYKEEVTKFLCDNGVANWECRFAHERNISLVYKGDSFYTIDIFAQYKETYVDKCDTPQLIWTYAVNVASHGMTHIIEPTNRDTKAYEYYKMIGRLFSDINFSKELEKLCKRNVNELLVFKNTYREIHSEYCKLYKLKETIKKTECTKKFLDLAKTSDKNMFVIIDKYTDPEFCVATYRKEPCIICCEPCESKFELTVRCKEQNRYMNTHYNVVQIKNLKF